MYNGIDDGAFKTRCAMYFNQIEVPKSLLQGK